MKKQKSLKVNAMMNAILTTASVLFPLITFPYVSRILLPEGTGRVSFASSIVSYFVMFAQLGIPTYGIRACAKVRDDKQELSRVVQEIFLINAVISIITYTAFIITLRIVPRFNEEKVLFIILSFQIIFNTIGMEWLYKALEQYTYITIRSIVFKFIAVLATFAMIKSKSDYVAYAGITIFASSASNILNFLNLRRIIEIKTSRNYDFKRHLRPIFVFFAMSCATTIYTNLDNVMLGFMKTETDVGYYNAALKIRNILVSIVTSLGVVLLPRSSYYYENKEYDEFNRITGKALNFIILLAIPIAVFFIIFSREGIYFLSGAAYEKAVIPMRIIMVTLIFIGMTNIIGIQMLIPAGREIMVLNSEIAGAIIDVVINVFLIPTMGAAGAAIGTVIAEIVVWIIQLSALKNNVKLAYSNIHWEGIIASTVLGVLVSFWVKFLPLSIFLKLLIGGGFFFMAYTMTLLWVVKDRLATEIFDQTFKKFQKIKKNGGE